MKKQLTIAELHAITTEAMAKGYGDAPIYFDTDAVCFDVHMVAVDGACYDDQDFIKDVYGVPVVMTLGWDMKREPFHWNTQSETKEDRLCNCERCQNRGH